MNLEEINIRRQLVALRRQYAREGQRPSRRVVGVLERLLKDLKAGASSGRTSGFDTAGYKPDLGGASTETIQLDVGLTPKLSWHLEQWKMLGGWGELVDVDMSNTISVSTGKAPTIEVNPDDSFALSINGELHLGSGRGTMIARVHDNKPPEIYRWMRVVPSYGGAGRPLRIDSGAIGSFYRGGGQFPSELQRKVPYGWSSIPTNWDVMRHIVEKTNRKNIEAREELAQIAEALGYTRLPHQFSTLRLSDLRKSAGRSSREIADRELYRISEAVDDHLAGELPRSFYRTTKRDQLKDITGGPRIANIEDPYGFSGTMTLGRWRYMHRTTAMVMPFEGRRVRQIMQTAKLHVGAFNVVAVHDNGNIRLLDVSNLRMTLWPTVERMWTAHYSDRYLPRIEAVDLRGARLGERPILWKTKGMMGKAATRRTKWRDKAVELIEAEGKAPTGDQLDTLPWSRPWTDMLKATGIFERLEKMQF